MGGRINPAIQGATESILPASDRINTLVRFPALGPVWDLAIPINLARVWRRNLRNGGQVDPLLLGLHLVPLTARPRPAITTRTPMRCCNCPTRFGAWCSVWLPDAPPNLPARRGDLVRFPPPSQRGERPIQLPCNGLEVLNRVGEVQLSHAQVVRGAGNLLRSLAPINAPARIRPCPTRHERTGLGCLRSRPLPNLPWLSCRTR